MEKDELTRQCEMAWERGFTLGVLVGSVGVLVITVIILLVF